MSTEVCIYCGKPVTQSQLKHAEAINVSRGKYAHTDCIDDLSRQPGDAHRRSDYDGLEEPTAEMAADRVDGEKRLQQYRDILIEYDWPEQEEHWEWVATAKIDDIVDWAETIREAET